MFKESVRIRLLFSIFMKLRYLIVNDILLEGQYTNYK